MASGFSIDPTLPWNLTGFQMKRGEKYRLSAEAFTDKNGRPYSDKGLRCTPDGPIGFKGWLFDLVARDARRPFNPLYWFGPGKIKRLRVLTDRTGRRASFLTVIGAIGQDDSRENVFVIGTSREITAHANGELMVFSNDWPGGSGMTGEARFENSKTYCNNTGCIRVTIEAAPE